MEGVNEGMEERQITLKEHKKPLGDSLVKDFPREF